MKEIHNPDILMRERASALIIPGYESLINIYVGYNIFPSIIQSQI